MSSASPVFGKRNAPVAPSRAGVPRPAGETSARAAAPLPDADYAAFLAATRAEFAKPKHDDRPVVVPRSIIGASLAGLIVGCCLVGLDIAQAKQAVMPGEMTIDLSALIGASSPAGLPGGGSGGISPGLVLAGVLGGARAAGACLMIGHEALSRLGQTSHVAYIAAGAASALAFAGVLAFATGIPPSHGWLITGLAGAGAGFFYRMFAGARAA